MQRGLHVACTVVVVVVVVVGVIVVVVVDALERSEQRNPRCWLTLAAAFASFFSFPSFPLRVARSCGARIDDGSRRPVASPRAPFWSMCPVTMDGDWRITFARCSAEA